MHLKILLLKNLVGRHYPVPPVVSALPAGGEAAVAGGLMLDGVHAGSGSGVCRVYTELGHHILCLPEWTMAESVRGTGVQCWPGCGVGFSGHPGFCEKSIPEVSFWNHLRKPSLVGELAPQLVSMPENEGGICLHS